MENKEKTLKEKSVYFNMKKICEVAQVNYQVYRNWCSYPDKRKLPKEYLDKLLIAMADKSFFEIEKDKNDLLVEYLDERIKDTPDEFKKLMEGIIAFKKNTNIELSVFVSPSFSCWGDCFGLGLTVGETPSDIEKELFNCDDIEKSSRYNITDFVFDFFNGLDLDDEDHESAYEDAVKYLKRENLFDKYKSDFMYMKIAERMKEKLEIILEASDYAVKDNGMYGVSLYHGSEEVITFGTNYQLG